MANFGPCAAHTRLTRSHHDLAESVKVMKDVGITLSSTRQCGITSSAFIDIEKIRAVIINEVRHCAIMAPSMHNQPNDEDACPSMH